VKNGEISPISAAAAKKWPENQQQMAGQAAKTAAKRESGENGISSEMASAAAAWHVAWQRRHASGIS